MTTATEVVQAIREWRYRHIVDSIEFSYRLFDNPELWESLYSSQIVYESYFCFLHATSQVIRPESIAEVGVFFGYGAKAMITGSPRARAYVGYDNSCYAPFAVPHAKQVVLPALGVEWAVHDVDTRRIRELPGLEARSVDLAYIDGEHTVQAVWNDLMLIFPKMRPGGWILLDDVMLFGLTHPCVDFAERNGMTWAFVPTHNGAMLMGPVS